MPSTTRSSANRELEGTACLRRCAALARPLSSIVEHCERLSYKDKSTGGPRRRRPLRHGGGRCLWSCAVERLPGTDRARMLKGSSLPSIATMARAKKREVPRISPDEAHKLVTLADRATKEFRGQFDELEAAIGMLMVGRLVGWKVLVLIHNKRTIRKYEEILGITVRDFFPEVGPLAEKSLAFRAVEQIGSFWKAVSGEVKVEGRREMDLG